MKLLYQLTEAATHSVCAGLKVPRLPQQATIRQLRKGSRVLFEVLASAHKLTALTVYADYNSKASFIYITRHYMKTQCAYCSSRICEIREQVFER